MKGKRMERKNRKIFSKGQNSSLITGQTLLIPQGLEETLPQTAK